MLIIKRKKGTSVMFNHAGIAEFVITVYKVPSYNCVKLAITGPRTVIVERIAARFEGRLKRASKKSYADAGSNGTITLTIALGEPLMIATSPYSDGKVVSVTILKAVKFSYAVLGIDCSKDIRVERLDEAIRPA